MNFQTLASTAETDSVGFSRPRVLVVEDDEFLREINQQILVSAGYDVEVAEDGSMAWDRLQLQGYDLLVTDNQMPNVSGMELVQKIRGAGLTLPVVMATGTLPGNGFARSHAHCPVTTVLKPYTHTELLATVNAVLGRDRNHCASALTPHGDSQPLTRDLQFC